MFYEKQYQTQFKFLPTSVMPDRQSWEGREGLYCLGLIFDILVCNLVCEVVLFLMGLSGIMSGLAEKWTDLMQGLPGSTHDASSGSVQGLHWTVWVCLGGFLRLCARAAMDCLDPLKGFP